MTREEKLNIIRKYRKLTLKKLCEISGISKQAIIKEVKLSDATIDKLVEIIKDILKDVTNGEDKETL